MGARTYRLPAIITLKKLVALGEGPTLEFKRKATFPEKIVREMIAFANTAGGTVLIGVSDDGTIPGVKFPEEDSFILKKALKAYCLPNIDFNEEIMQVAPQRFVIRYDVSPGFRKPYSLKVNGRMETFIRVGDKTMKASHEMRQILKKRNTKRGTWFTYGEHEKRLFAYLALHPSITVKEFSKISQLSRFNASRKLVRLVLANVLKITPTERGDKFETIFP